VFVHAGTRARHQYGPIAADTAERGLRLISYDRPGYGGSDSQPGRTVADCADDVRAICGALSIDGLAMWGWSGGGPRVLACAALFPDLVTAVAALASLALYDADGLDYFAGMDRADIDDYRLLVADPAAARARWDQDREALLAASPDDLAQGWLLICRGGSRWPVSACRSCSCTTGPCRSAMANGWPRTSQG
jgi:pimeloyl-ACP methyl ester carboxylesterase